MRNYTMFYEAVDADGVCKSVCAADATNIVLFVPGSDCYADNPRNGSICLRFDFPAHKGAALQTMYALEAASTFSRNLTRQIVRDNLLNVATTIIDTQILPTEDAD